MRPRNPEIIDGLASEYVLGTLRGPARRRLERWRASTPSIDARCRFWEDRLMYLAKGLWSVPPPAHVWMNIRRRLNLSSQDRKSRRMPSLALAASVLLAVGLAAVSYWHNLAADRATALATLSAEAGNESWQLEVIAHGDRLFVRSAGGHALSAQHDFELWALPKGGAPVSLGILPPEGSLTRTLSAAQKRALQNSSQVAVSIEPPGGSPTGQPTGAVSVAPLRMTS